MLAWASNKVTKLFATRQQPIGVDVHLDIYGRIVERGDDFFHPKKFRGIPVFDVDSIYRHYKPQMEKIRTHFDIGDQRKTPSGESLYKVLVEDIVKRYIEFCHMIPASEDHHHSTTGGLLLHSLEASVESLRWAKEKDPRVTGFVDIDAKVKPVMIYCAWLAALLHDAGKMMRDISVDAVEILNEHNQLVKPHNSIVSWHPARESLIEWAKHHRVASYSVNFLQGRVHRRHNIDSSQILQPLLRGQYAMEYLLSTPINQQVYNDITRVLSGYSTSDDFLSESVRMGDAASTSRSLGYFYDTRLGSRAISTAQRLFKTIQAAASEWEWNRNDGKGWIIGNDVYIRWTSAIDNILKVSIDLGYSLPTDVKNILNIMDSNLITDLFDRRFPDDRIIRFMYGKFDESALKNIRDGNQPTVWHDLLKLRGPQIIFSEAPMPFSQPGIVHLPHSDRYYLINKDGEIVATLSAGNELDLVENDTNQNKAIANAMPDTQTDENENATQKTKPKSKPKKKQGKQSQKVSPAQVNVNDLRPGKANTTAGLNGIVFKQITPESDDEKSSTDTQPASQKPTLTKKSKLSATLQSLLEAGIRHFVVDGHVLLPLEDAEAHTELTSRTIIAKLDKASELHLDMSRPNRKTWMHNIDDDTKIKCIKLTKACSSHFDSEVIASLRDNPSEKTDTQTTQQAAIDEAYLSNMEDDDKQPSIEAPFIDADQPDLFPETEQATPTMSTEHADLIHDLDKHSLLHLLKNRNELSVITTDDKGFCVFNHNSLSPGTRKVISVSLLRNLLRDKGYKQQPGGFRLPIKQLKSIQLSEVSNNG